MRLTVAICTWNRADLLDQTLAQMRHLDNPASVDWELLVVNNNCTDQTDEVITHHDGHLPIRRLFESRPGQSNARNCAIRAAKGDLILWTDDDVLVDSNWLSAYHEAALEYPDAGFFGGKILPWFEGTPPKWLAENWRVVEGAFAVRDLGDEPLEFNAQMVPYGANFAVRTQLQRNYLFNPELGLRPDSSMRGDETTLLRQMLSDGVTGRWIAGAQVQHFIPKTRQNIKYLWEFSQGYGEYLAKRTGRVKGGHWFGRPRWLWRKAFFAALRYYQQRALGSPQKWLRHLSKYGELQGHFRAYGSDAS